MNNSKFDERLRKVVPTGISLTIMGVRAKYWAPPLVNHIGRSVKVRAHPDDVEKVLVFSADTGDFICAAWRLKAIPRDGLDK
jgi:hypothetical protein